MSGRYSSPWIVVETKLVNEITLITGNNRTLNNRKFVNLSLSFLNRPRSHVILPSHILGMMHLTVLEEKFRFFIL